MGQIKNEKSLSFEFCAFTLNQIDSLCFCTQTLNQNQSFTKKQTKKHFKKKSLDNDSAGHVVDLRERWRGIDICDTGKLASVCNHLMTQWIDPVLSVERNTIGILMVIGTEANQWLQPHWSWCWHFHPISTSYRHQRKRNFVTCLHVEREEENQEERQ